LVPPLCAVLQKTSDVGLEGREKKFAEGDIKKTRKQLTTCRQNGNWCL
jgi:hypothetical protein